MISKIKQLESEPQNNLKQKVVASSGQSGNSEKLRAEKYKKMLNRYEKEEEKQTNLPQPTNAGNPGVICKTQSNNASPLNKSDRSKYKFERKYTQGNSPGKANSPKLRQKE